MKESEIEQLRDQLSYYHSNTVSYKVLELIGHIDNLNLEIMRLNRLLVENNINSSMVRSMG